MSTLPIEAPSAKLSHWLIGVALAALVWFAAYSQLASFADWLVQALGLSRQTHFREAEHFSLYDTPKVSK